MSISPLKILFVTNNYTPYSGGVVSSIFLHATELRRQGHEVIIVTLDFLNSKNEHEDHVIRLYCPLRCIYRTNHMALPWRATHQLKKIIKQLNPHLIHVHHPFLLGKAAARVARYYAIPLIFTYHTLYEHYVHYIPLVPAPLAKPMITYLVKKFCQTVNGIIAPSRFVEEKLKTITKEIKTALIPSGIAASFFTEKSAPLKLKKDFFQLLTVSRFAKEKNIYFLLDVVATLNPHTFKACFVGYGPEKNNLLIYAQHKKIPKDMISFIERPSKKALINYYQQADLFIFASQTETQGLVLAEALSQGTPIVALQGPGQQDVIEQGKNGFLVHSREEMKHYIELIASDYQLHYLLQKNALITAQQFTPEKVTKSLLSFYYKVITQ